MSDMQKLAQDAPAILQAGAKHLRKMAQANVDLQREKEALEHEVRVMKLARRMEVRGLQPSLSFEEKVAALKDVDGEKLAHMEHGVEIAAGGFRLGELEDPAERSTKAASAPQGESYALDQGGSDSLDQFVLSGQALG
jgi:hypothetical protein